MLRYIFDYIIFGYIWINKQIQMETLHYTHSVLRFILTFSLKVT